MSPARNKTLREKEKKSVNNHFSFSLNVFKYLFLVSLKTGLCSRGLRYYPGSVKLFPKRQILDSSKLKETADDHFKFDEKGRQFSKREENTVEKGEIARYEQFLFFPQCFQKTCTADT